MCVFRVGLGLFLLVPEHTLRYHSELILFQCIISENYFQMQKLKQSSKKKEIIESASLPRSKGPQVNLVPLENRKSPGNEVRVHRYPKEGGWRGTQESFSEVQPLILLYTIYDRLRYFFRLPSIDNCILFTYLV